MKPDLHVKLVNDFSLSVEYIADTTSYYLLHWSTLYTFKKLSENSDGMIQHNGELFIPVFKSESFPLDSSSQLMLSFRIVPASYRIPNYVLIKAMP
jgi:hypothetical protein